MSIASLSQTRFGITTIVSAVSDLTPPPVYFFWYLDGNYVGVTTGGSWTFVLAPGQSARVDVLDSLDPDFDALGNAPVAYPATRTIAFVRSTDAGVASYRIEQSEDGGATWTPIAVLNADPSQWEYRFQTDPLDDLAAVYQFRVIPVSQAGDDGTEIDLAGELIVRTPDAPAFVVAFDPGATKVTFSAA